MSESDAGAYGICHLGVVPVRTEPSDKAEIGTQLLFGDIFTIVRTSDDKKWIFIQIACDQYQGWIDVKQYKRITQPYFEEFLSTVHPFSKNPVSQVSNSQTSYFLLQGSTIPFFNHGITDIGEEKMHFKGELLYADTGNDFKSLERTAKQYLGAPYLWGGKSLFGIDCSGFVQQVFKMHGCRLPRDSWQQAESGAATTNARPGDLAFFNNPQGKIIHVGIVLESDKIIHASGEVRIDRIDTTGIFNEERNCYSHKLALVRKVTDQA